MADDRITVRLPDGMREQIRDARGEVGESEYVMRALRIALGAMAPGDWPGHPGGPAEGLPASHEIPAGGIDSAGVACAWSACWARDTRRFGVTDAHELTRGGYLERPRDEELVGMALCPTHASRLNGFRYVRPRRPLPRTAEPAGV